MTIRKYGKPEQKCIDYVDLSRTVLPHDTMRRQMMPSLYEFILKEKKDQSLDDQVEVTPNQSKIQKLLMENEMKDIEGLGTGLFQTREDGAVLSPTPDESPPATYITRD